MIINGLSETPPEQEPEQSAAISAPPPAAPLGCSALFPMTAQDVFWLCDSIVTQVMRSVKDAFPWDGKKQQILTAHKD